MTSGNAGHPRVPGWLDGPPQRKRSSPTDSVHEPPIIPEQPVPIVPADNLVAATYLCSSPHAELTGKVDEVARHQLHVVVWA